MKYITVLGSTGSIGKQTLEVVENLKDVKIEGLSANSSIELLEEQVRKFSPEYVCVTDEKKAEELKIKIADTGTRVLSGKQGLNDIACLPKSGTVVTAVVGIAGLEPTMSAIRAKKRIALANKETLVTAGEIVMSEAAQNGVEIIPVDSEHSAIFQCLGSRYLNGSNNSEIKNILLTCSGGPFFGKNAEELKKVTRAQALAHPNWSMGAKITIDSATLMNKGLEVIEATHLFNVDIDRVKVLVHRKSVIHSMVEFCDNAVLAQLGAPDMKLPIQYAITYPERKAMYENELDLLSCGALEFNEPDTKTFKCLELAYNAAKIGGSMPVVLNGANEVAVSMFLNDKIKFLDIADIVEGAMDNHKVAEIKSVADVLEADRWAREYVCALADKI